MYPQSADNPDNEVIGEIFLVQGRAVLFSREREHAPILRHLGRPSDGARRDQGGADEERRVGAAASLRGLGRILGQAGVRGAKTAGTPFNSSISFTKVLTEISTVGGVRSTICPSVRRCTERLNRACFQRDASKRKIS